MPIRRAVLMIRQAISPRLAIKMRLNMRRALTPCRPLGFAASAAKSQLKRRVELLHDCLIEGITNISPWIPGSRAVLASRNDGQNVGSTRGARDHAPRSSRLAIDCATGDTAAPQTTAAMVASDALKRFLPLMWEA